MLELELTYLAKTLPEGLADAKKKEILDIYVPGSIAHPTTRLRKSGDKYEITKKLTINNDHSEHTEETISLTEAEFSDLATAPGKRVRKIRYYIEHGGRTAEVDVFQDDLAGLVVVDFEFDTREEKDSFTMPSFCLANVTQDEVIAGGMLSGKSYADIAPHLTKYGYTKLSL